MQPALKDLTEVKIQIEQDFKNTPSRRSEILNQLGYTNHFKQAQKKDYKFAKLVEFYGVDLPAFKKYANKMCKKCIVLYAK